MRARIGNLQIAYEDTGGRVPLLLIHGFPLDRTMWDGQIVGLPPAARVIAPDLRGFGESEVVPGTATMDAYAGDACGLLDRLGLERAVIGGLSMGGYAALAFARLYPERMRALILSDTRATADSPEARKGRLELIERVRARGADALVEAMFPKLLAPNTYSARPDFAERVRQMILRTPVEGAAAALRGIAERPDSTPNLATIACPTLVLVGEHDAITPVADSESITSKVPGAQLATIPGAGHLAPLENPSAVNAEIAQFLEALAR